MSFDEDKFESYKNGKIIFVLGTLLTVPKIEVQPSVEGIQKLLNSIGQTIVSVVNGVGKWKNLQKRTNHDKEGKGISEKQKKKPLYNPVKVEIPLIDEKETNFYKSVSETKDVTRSLTVLSTSMKGLKLELTQFKAIWKKYSEVWMIDRDEYIEEMGSRKPKSKEYEQELNKYRRI